MICRIQRFMWVRHNISTITAYIHLSEDLLPLTPQTTSPYTCTSHTDPYTSNKQGNIDTQTGTIK